MTGSSATEALSKIFSSARENGGLTRASVFDLARLAEELEAPPPPGFEKLRVLLDDFSQLPPAPIAESLRDRLRGYQKQGVDWLHFLKRAGLGALLADDMGLGKTVQALSVLEGRSLVVAPTSVLRNWMAEARSFRPDLSLSFYHGRDRRLDPEADLTGDQPRAAATGPGAPRGDRMGHRRPRRRPGDSES